MILEVRLPQWGMGMTEGTVISWECEEGDEVFEGDVLATIEVAKSECELYSPAAGVVESIVVAEGETADVREVMVTLRVNDTSSPA